MTETILIVEDEPSISEAVAFMLEKEGYETCRCKAAGPARQALAENNFSLVILDIGLPDMNGFDFCRELLQDYPLPVIFLTARSDEIDRIVGLEMGADDYVTKPFSPRELIARVKALLRRSGSPESGIIEHGPLHLDLAAHELTISGKPVRLGPTEFRLLEHFMTNPGRAFDRSQLLDRVWGRSVYVEERTVDVHILRLRKALKPFGLQHLVQTVRGVGYRYLQPDQ